MKNDSLGDMLKSLEKTYEKQIYASSYVYFRFDGRSFSKFTKKLDRPYDLKFIEVMKKTTIDVMKEFSFDFGYVQSDEISVLWKPKGSLIFEGKIQKLLSVISSFVSVSFFKNYIEIFGVIPKSIPVFDGRVTNFADADTSSRMFFWRHKDAKKNAINSIATHHFGSKKIQGIGTGERKALLGEDILNKVSMNFLYGTFIIKDKKMLENSSQFKYIYETINNQEYYERTVFTEICKDFKNHLELFDNVIKNKSDS